MAEEIDFSQVSVVPEPKARVSSTTFPFFRTSSISPVFPLFSGVGLVSLFSQAANPNVTAIAVNLIIMFFIEEIKLNKVISQFRVYLYPEMFFLNNCSFPVGDNHRHIGSVQENANVYLDIMPRIWYDLHVTLDCGSKEFMSVD